MTEQRKEFGETWGALDPTLSNIDAALAGKYKV
jgi:hypothetical protein